MANPDGKNAKENAKAGRAVRDLVNAPPKAGVNNLAVTHKTNVADAFGKEFADLIEREGRAIVLAVLIARVQAREPRWQVPDLVSPRRNFGPPTGL